jgi:hypothetical protein
MEYHSISAHEHRSGYVELCMCVYDISEHSHLCIQASASTVTHTSKHGASHHQQAQGPVHPSMEHRSISDHRHTLTWKRSNWTSGPSQVTRAEHTGMRPTLMYISLYWSCSRLARSAILELPDPISGNLYSKAYFPVMRSSSPLSSSKHGASLHQRAHA